MLAGRRNSWVRKVRKSKLKDGERKGLRAQSS